MSLRAGAAVAIINAGNFVIAGIFREPRVIEGKVDANDTNRRLTRFFPNVSLSRLSLRTHTHTHGFTIEVRH